MWYLENTKSLPPKKKNSNNNNKKRYSFHKNQVSGFIQRLLDHFFISNTLQDFVKKTFSTDHSPIFFSFEQENDSVRGRGLWKFNKPLIADSQIVSLLKI